MLITLHNITTGEIQFVSSLEGVNMEQWEETGQDPPADLETVAYSSVAGIITPIIDPRDAQWELIKRARDEAKQDTLSTPYGVFDCDTESRSLIAGASQAASALLSRSQTFSTVWTLADNSLVTLNGEDMINVGLLVVARIESIHNHATTLRAQIYDENNTIEQIRLITWESEV